MEYSEMFSCAGVRIDIRVKTETKMERLLSDLTFLRYRLAGVERETSSSRAPAKGPDLFWDRTKLPKDIRWTGECVELSGSWEEGELQRVIVSLFARKLEENNLFPFHASGIRLSGKNILFLGGESNSGKSMSQIEGSRRGGEILSTETFILDREGKIVSGSTDVFLVKRAKGTERIDKLDLSQGIHLFFEKEPAFVHYTGDETNIDLVVLPDIDGHFNTAMGEMATYEKEYQTFHCICDYWGDRILLASGFPMPLLDTDELRRKRAVFIAQFALRPYFYIRAKTPQLVLDEVEKIVDKIE